MEKTNSSPDLYTAIQLAVQEIALSRLKQVTGRSDLVLEDLDKSADLSFDHWVCFVLVGLPGVNVAFRCHFSSRAARELASAALQKPGKQVESELSHSFIAEFCNLVGGGLKNKLSALLKAHVDTSKQAVLHGPEKIPSYDLGVPKPAEGQSNRLWNVKWSSGTITISCALEIDIAKLKEAFGPNLERFATELSTFAQVSDSSEVNWF